MYTVIFNIFDYCKGSDLISIKQNVFYWNRRGVKVFDTFIGRFWNDLENNLYTEKQFIFYLCVVCLKKGSSSLYKINNKEVRKELREFSVKRTEEDQRIIDSVLEENNIKLDDMFCIRENGQSLMFELFRKDLISVCLILKYSNKFLTSVEKNHILISCNKKYKQFIRALQLTTKLLQGELS
jgi:hypothetical protein